MIIDINKKDDVTFLDIRVGQAFLDKDLDLYIKVRTQPQSLVNAFYLKDGKSACFSNKVVVVRANVKIVDNKDTILNAISYGSSDNAPSTDADLSNVFKNGAL